MKISKPSTKVVDPRIDLVPSLKEANETVRGRGIQSKKVPEDYRDCATCPSSISPETSVSRSRSRGLHHPLDGKAIYVLKIRMFRSHVQMTTREGKGLEEIAPLRRSPLLARVWVEAGLATEAAYNGPQPREGPHHFQEINGSDREDDPHHILPPSLVPRRRSRGGCPFLGEDQHGGEEEDC
ncbi:hypothetical protein GWK47_001684 [Chionoecetes opilio]|uniref:Uncharacterized protein n=1 Tax=Chionoecetes opilio TaxID=41210 RepID=A0A8J4XXV9_CHIOP|nr:hypothetical protein GWK47_001684 [Chionoecetes opilio]